MDARVNSCGCERAHSVTSAHYDMGIDNNSTLQEAWQFGDPTDTTWNFTGALFAMDVQVTYYDAVPKLSLTSQAGQIVVDDPVQRVLHLNVDPATIQTNLNPGAYVYDLVMTDFPFGVARKTALLHGILCVTQGVTGVT